MDFGTMPDDALAYKKQGVFENTGRWLKLILAILCPGIFGGIILFIFKVKYIAIPGFIFALILIILTLAPLFAVFQARYLTKVYDSASPEA